LDPVVVGGLSKSKLFDVGTAVYATSAPAGEIRQKLGIKTERRPSKVREVAKKEVFHDKGNTRRVSQRHPDVHV
jgi:hypothetical protein